MANSSPPPKSSDLHSKINIQTSRDDIFDFLALSYDIREKIYEYVLVRPHTIKCYESIEKLDPSGSLWRHSIQLNEAPSWRFIPINLTCRQIRQESTAVFLRGNTFELYGPTAAFAFLSNLGACRRLLLQRVTYHHQLPWSEFGIRVDSLTACRYFRSCTRLTRLEIGFPHLKSPHGRRFEKRLINALGFFRDRKVKATFESEWYDNEDQPDGLSDFLLPRDTLAVLKDMLNRSRRQQHGIECE